MLKNNKLDNSIFVHTYEDDSKTDVFIDLSKVLSFYHKEVSSNSNSRFTLAIKYVENSNAQYAFNEMKPIEDFIKKYNDYKATQSQIAAISDKLVVQISEAMSAQLEKEKEKQQDVFKDLLAKSVEKLQEDFRQELKSFTNEVSNSAKIITETALKHQKDINSENEKHLSVLNDLTNQSNELMESLSTYNVKFAKFVGVINALVPPSEQEKVEEIEKAAILEERLNS